MLDTDANSLRDEIEEAIAVNHKHTDNASQLRKLFAGRGYRTDWLLEEENHENFGFEFVANWLPGMIYDNPAVIVETSLPGVFDDQIDALEHYTNQWMQDIDFSGIVTQIAYNIPFSFGMALCTLELSPGYEGEHRLPWLNDEPGAPPLRPVVIPIQDKRYFVDPQATMHDRRRFEGHIWIIDKDDLIRQKGPDGKPIYDRKAVEAAAPDTGFEELYGNEDPRKAHPQRTQRNQVIGYECYVPEKQMIYTLAYTSSRGTERSMEFLREPRRAFCHPKGPYVRYGIYDVPGQIYPLPMLAVTADLVEEINAHAGQASDDAGTAKRLIAVDSNQKNLQNHVANTQNGTVIGIPGLQAGAVQQLEFGGAQPANLDYVDRLRERLDRISGLTETKRGRISGATAFEVNKAEEGTDARAAFQKRMFMRSVVDTLERCMWFMHESKSVYGPVSVVNPQSGRKEAFIFRGGPQPGFPHPPFRSLQAKIEPYTMEYVDEMVLQRRVLQALDITTNSIAPAVTQFPFLKAKPLADDLFEALNIREGGSRYIDFDILNAYLQAAQQQLGAMAGAEGGGGEGAGPVPPGFDPIAEEAAMLAA
jgi:hypothetical protein